jgi:hypothetical protein
MEDTVAESGTREIATSRLEGLSTMPPAGSRVPNADQPNAYGITEVPLNGFHSQHFRRQCIKKT